MGSQRSVLGREAPGPGQAGPRRVARGPGGHASLCVLAAEVDRGEAGPHPDCSQGHGVQPPAGAGLRPWPCYSARSALILPAPTGTGSRLRDPPGVPALSWARRAAGVSRQLGGPMGGWLGTPALAPVMVAAAQRDQNNDGNSRPGRGHWLISRPLQGGGAASTGQRASPEISRQDGCGQGPLGGAGSGGRRAGGSSSATGLSAQQAPAPLSSRSSREGTPWWTDRFRGAASAAVGPSRADLGLRGGCLRTQYRKLTNEQACN